jgi:hypothetical protein
VPVLPEKCDVCWGCELWALGDAVPMGPIDFIDGLPNKKCSKCGFGGDSTSDEKSN